ncbi:sterile alpha motif domain-containing protein 3-like [Misgurnus anguillicaudatus]|uniref:sterile alpha motif domain-containing protein 3-like n=1 Tax=Misgurnus anguillicaudatus TaxID=75329 RepID=UPI0024357A13|nr:sterile alpha motif domain-containing protein 3-like isoform X2 [Misgurnus anguillicaudatus]XP_055032105.1 sterile alpha motif domain-containing protein 3-like isoform X2 [Misgurnus anguillicaudatus]
MSMMFRVIVHDSDIRKVVISEKPADVEALKRVLQEKLQVTYSFNVQFEDPDFNHALCNLSDINDLPDKATLKIIPLSTSPSSSQADTVLLSGSDTSEQLSAERQSEWPEDFEIPKFSVNVEYRLRQGNLAFMKDGTSLDVGRDIKHDILESLAGAMYTFKAYPSDENFAQVATALIRAHPCLTEPGSSTGSAGWKNSLKFKMANYRTKLRKCGCSDVAVEGKRGAEAGSAFRRSIKKPRRFEVNFLPNFPNGENEDSQECLRKELVEEMKKKSRDMSLIGQKMDSTFALRRKEIIHSEPPVSEILEKWPALFTESQIFAEFHRISGKNLRSEFYAALDKHSARFLEIFRKKGGTQGRTLDEILRQVDLKSSDVSCVRTAVLYGLPVLLGDDSDEFFKTCFDSDVDADFSQIDVGLLTVLPEDMPARTPHALNVNAMREIILEGKFVMDDVRSLPHAVCLLFALIYALNLDYPKTMRNTFEFIQRVFLSLGGKNLKPKLQTLKNQLLT